MSRSDLRWGILSAAFGLLVACAEPIVLQIPLEAPDLSAVVAVVSKGTPNYFAIDDDFRQMQPILQSIRGKSGDGPVEVHVLYYEEPLAELGLTAGLVYSEPSGKELVGESHSLSAIIDSSDEVRWSVPSFRPPVFEALLRVRASPCRKFRPDGPVLLLETNEVPLNFMHDALGTQWLVTHLAGTQQGRVRRVEVDGLGPPLTMQEGFRVTAAIGTEAGHIFVAGGRGRTAELLHGVPGEPLNSVAVAESGPSSTWPRHMVVGQDLDGDEVLYMLTPQGAFSAYAQGVWAVLSDAAGTGALGGLTWVQPGEVLVLSPTGQRILRYTGGEFSVEDTALDDGLLGGGDELTAVAHIPGLGTLAGTENGYLLTRQARQWEVAQTDAIVGATIEVITAYREGALVSGRYGIIDQYFEGTGYCLPRDFFGNDVTVDRVSVHEGRPVVVAHRSRQPGYFVQWISVDRR